MADLTSSLVKVAGSAPYPEDGVKAVWPRLRPVITVPELKALYLPGIDLVSGSVDTLTGQKMVFTDDLLALYIERAIEQAEEETGIFVTPVEIKEKHPYDQLRYQSFGYMVSKHRPIGAVLQLAIVASDDSTLYVVPPNWIEMANANKGQINVIPMLNGYTSNGTTTPFSHALLLAFGRHWVPALWQLHAIVGYPDGMVPPAMNDLIGTIAAMRVLSALAATNAKTTSVSVGMDGISQSVGGPGGAVYDNRLKELSDDKQRLVGKVKSLHGSRIFSSDV